MGIFSPSTTTLEQRVAQLESDLLASQSSVSTLTDDLAGATERAVSAEASLAAAQESARAAQESFAAADVTAARQSALVAAILPALGLTPEAAAGLTPETAAATIAAALEDRAGRRAVELAASQGTPPVPSTPAGPGAEKPDLAALAADVRNATTPEARMKAHSAWSAAQKL